MWYDYFYFLQFIDEEVLQNLTILLELNDLEQAGILHYLQVIGEASRALTFEFKEKYNQINWSEIIAFRNIIVHQYSNVDWDIIVRVIYKDLPILKQLVEIIVKDFK